MRRGRFLPTCRRERTATCMPPRTRSGHTNGRGTRAPWPSGIPRASSYDFPSRVRESEGARECGRAASFGDFCDTKRMFRFSFESKTFFPRIHIASCGCYRRPGCALCHRPGRGDLPRCRGQPAGHHPQLAGRCTPAAPTATHASGDSHASGAPSSQIRSAGSRLEATTWLVCTLGH